MAKKTVKEKFIIDEEQIEAQQYSEEEEGVQEERTLKPKLSRKQERKAKITYLQEFILKILKKGTVNSKTSLIHLLIKSGVKEYNYKLNIFRNKLIYDIPALGGALKELRFKNKINFTIENGSHIYFLNIRSKELKSKEREVDFNWKTYSIPTGTNEIYVVLKIPGSNPKPYHFLSSLFPRGKILNYTIEVDKKFERTKRFILKHGVLEGYFDEDKLILKCSSSDQDVTKTLYVLYQIGRYIVKELVSLNRRSTELLKIYNIEDSYFIPMVPIFRAKDKNAFYTSKYTNALRSMFDFPKKFERKNVFGRYSALSNEIKDEEFDLTEFNKFIEEAFKFEIKAYITNAITNNWIINPNKALNYMEEDEDLRNLIEEYFAEIDTDRIIREKLEVSMERGEFLKDLTTNLLLTLLGLSILTDYPPFQYAIIVFFIVINISYFIIKSRKSKKLIIE
ncbi:MAG: hypothetical protein BAJALOKI1v1_1950006 [Promethearchaeota archaeon]|nr:MAG: hypothetical protein BAJALOKI1v1_1950006 [Candidatus Lokiarchaeota archaeon]